MDSLTSANAPVDLENNKPLSNHGTKTTVYERDFNKKYEACLRTIWYHLEPSLRRMFPDDRCGRYRCPYIPRSLSEFVVHYREFSQLVTERRQKLLEQKIQNQVATQRILDSLIYSPTAIPWPAPTPKEPFNGLALEAGTRYLHESGLPNRNFSLERDIARCQFPLSRELLGSTTHRYFQPSRDDNPSRGLVLSQKTIWCHRSYAADKLEAQWPCAAEYSWEGDQRVASENGRFRRFLPLPRNPSDLSVVPWQQVPLVETYPLDRVMRIPEYEDVFYTSAHYEVEAKDVKALLNRSLIEAMDVKGQLFTPARTRATASGRQVLRRSEAEGLCIAVASEVDPPSQVRWTLRKESLHNWLPFLSKTPEPPPPPTTLATQLLRIFEAIQRQARGFLEQARENRGAPADFPASSQQDTLKTLQQVVQKYIPPIAFDSLDSLLTTESLVTALAWLPILVTVFLMSSWFGRSSSWGSRFSPFGRSAANDSGQVNDSDFSYITSDDLDKHVPGGSKQQDVILIKYKKVHYPLHFPGGSIDRGELRVGQIKVALAQKMELGAMGAERMTLFFQGRNLKEDAKAARDVGLTSGTEHELLVDIAPAGKEDNDDDDDEEDDAEGADGTSTLKKKRKPRKKKGKKSALNSGTATPTSGTSTPNADATYVPTYIPPPRPNIVPAPVKPAAAPQTAMQKLDALSSAFHTKYVPECVLFANNPPKDKAKRQMDHKRLEETMMQQILLKLDAVETEGDPEARAKRKALVREVDAMMKTLDEADK